MPKCLTTTTLMPPRIPEHYILPSVVLSSHLTLISIVNTSLEKLIMIA